ncbi:helix-turn-helix transcriptional regulator [Micromonospora sp. NPDC049559]|uniref:helix-turn-helix domain-containing protein n=1 Tax=Micromonospora sp. NPDC049559 TaxID=3155923 RepID=UPI00342DDDAB
MREVGSSVPRRQLGRMLREAREQAGWGVDHAAEQFEWSRHKMYRIEQGATSVRSLDVDQMCRIYGVADDKREAMVGLAKETKAKGWWHSYGEVIPSWFELYVGMESAASAIRTYDTTLIPGLLQTADYARAIIQNRPGLTERAVRDAVALRMQRQDILTRTKPAPPMLEVMLDESVLLRPIGDADAWREQLNHLIDTRRAYNISVRVLPLSIGPHRGTDTGSGFTLLDFPSVGMRPPEPTTVYVELLTGALYLEKPDEVTAYDAVWEALREAAWSVEESASRIAAAIREIGDE